MILAASSLELAMSLGLSLLVGLVTGRWIVLAAPFGFWTVYVIGQLAGWWDEPSGEASPVTVALYFATLSALAAGAGVYVREALAARRRAGDSERNPRAGL